MEGRGLLYSTAAGGAGSSLNTNGLLHNHMPFPFLGNFLYLFFVMFV